VSPSIYVLVSLPHTMCIAKYLVLHLSTAFLLNFVTSSVILKALTHSFDLIYYYIQGAPLQV